MKPVTPEPKPEAKPNVLRMDEKDALILWAVVENFMLRHTQVEWVRLARMREDLAKLVEPGVVHSLTQPQKDV